MIHSSPEKTEAVLMLTPDVAAFAWAWLSLSAKISQRPSRRSVPDSTVSRRVGLGHICSTLEWNRCGKRRVPLRRSSIKKRSPPPTCESHRLSPGFRERRVEFFWRSRILILGTRRRWEDVRSMIENSSQWRFAHLLRFSGGGGGLTCRAFFRDDQTSWNLLVAKMRRIEGANWGEWS